MIKILFICHGNICRSPMAEAIFNHMVKEKGLEGEFFARLCGREPGKRLETPLIPLRRGSCGRKESPFAKRGAVQLTAEDYMIYTYIIGMDTYNIRGMRRILGEDPEGKISRLLDFTAQPRDVDDPWYTGDFDRAYEDIREGCQALLRLLISGGNK